MHKVSGAHMDSSLMYSFNYYYSFLLTLYLSVQPLLPPVTPLVSHRIPQLANPRNIQVLHRRILPIKVKVRHTLRVRIAALRESRDVLLQRNCNSRVRNAADGAGAGDVGVVESVGDVEAVERGRGGEQVSVGVVVEGFVEVEGVAGEAELGDDGGDAVEVVGVALGLAAVEDGRVEGGGQVVEGFRVGVDGWDGACDLCLDAAAVLDVWRSEEKTLLKC